jgi:hypothetical protein
LQAGFLPKASGNPPKQQQACEDHEQSEKTDLPILQLQKLLKPFLQLVLIPMNLIASLIGSVIVVITLPFKFIWSRLRPQ